LDLPVAPLFPVFLLHRRRGARLHRKPCLLFLLCFFGHYRRACQLVYLQAMVYLLNLREWSC